MTYFQIKHDPGLTLEQVAERVGRRLPASMKCRIMRPASWLSPRLLVEGSGKAGATIRLKQGPHATALLLDRMVIALRTRLLTMLRFILMWDDAGTTAAVRSILLDSGEFTGPDGGRPRRIFRPGVQWMQTSPEVFRGLGILKLLAGLALAGGILFYLGTQRSSIDLPPLLIFAAVAGLGARWAYTGVVNLRLCMPSIVSSLVPLVLMFVVALGVRSLAPSRPLTAEETAAYSALANQREKMLAGGPVGPYLAAVKKVKEYQSRPTEKLNAQFAEAVNTMVKRKTLLCTVARVTADESMRLPGIEDAMRTNDERLSKLKALMDRPFGESAAKDRPAADEIPFAKFDRKESAAHTDEPEGLDVIVPAQFARSLVRTCGGYLNSDDLKWDEELYKQGKVVVQFNDKRPSDAPEMQAKIDKWEPIFIDPSNGKDWPIERAAYRSGSHESGPD